MTGEDAGQMPEFYNTYVEEICARVEGNARAEFEFIWSERKKTGARSITLTNQVSENINDLFDVIHGSDVWNNVTLRNNVLKEMLPKTLM
jgi:glutamate dehydrogenase